MTEKEFEQLKVGDKVWCITNVWGREGIPYKLKVIGKWKDLGYIETSWLNGSHKTNLFKLDCHTTKVKALEAVIERCETHIKDKEDDIAYEKKEVERYKAELAKAKKEEEGWVIINEHIYKAFPSDHYRGFQKYPTEREAYEALAKFYKGKCEEALEKAGKIGYSIFSGAEPRILTVFNPTMEDGYPVGVDYDGCRFAPVCSGWFATRKEAEAELERRKKND